MVNILNETVKKLDTYLNWSSSRVHSGHEYFAPLKCFSVEKNMLFCSFTDFLLIMKKKINKWVLETFIVLFPSMHGQRIGATGVLYRKHTEYKTAED